MMDENCNKVKPLKTIACSAKDDSLRLNSSSGGLFSLIANIILAEGGIVYGTAMSGDCKKAEIIRVDNYSDLQFLRGSKYLQAKVGNAYNKVRSDLEKGYTVLFTGTPCQVNGLKLFLDKEYENLLCMDVICHGVPSPKLWETHVEYIEKTQKCKVRSVNFRCKDINWKNFGLKTGLSNHRYLYNHKSNDAYMQLFLNNYCLRPSCYSCVAKKRNLSDLTVGDFWGADLYAPEMNDGLGTSIVFVRSRRGVLLFEKIIKQVKCKDIPYEIAIKDNKAEYESVDKPLQRDTFFKDFAEMNYRELYLKYLYNTPKRRVKKFLIDVGIWNVIKKVGEKAKVNSERKFVDYGIVYMMIHK